MLTEKFNLPDDVKIECKRLSEYIASLFVSYFNKQIKKGKLGPNTLVSYHSYIRLAKQYEYNSMYFRKFENNLESNWGKSTLMITSNSKLLPSVYITLGIHPTQSVDGYITFGEAPKLFVLVSLTKFAKDFEESIKQLNEMIEHEVRHYIQFTSDPNRVVGLPKKSVRDKNYDIHGDNPSGDSTPHINKDAEFKPNLHTIVFYIEDHLNKHYSKDNWEIGFRKLISKKDRFKKTTETDTVLKWFDDIKKINVPKWKQYLKEVYSIIFNR